MELFIILLAISVTLLTSCSKSKNSASPTAINPVPITVSYKIVDTVFSMYSYSTGPNGFHDTTVVTSSTCSYILPITIDTLDSVKQLTIKGEHFVWRDDLKQYGKIGSSNFSGNYAGINITGDSVIIKVAQSNWQNWSKTYILSGIVVR